MKKNIVTAGCILLFFMVSVERVCSQQVGKRFIKFSNDWPETLTLNVSISVNGDEGKFTINETPPKGWVIGRTIPTASITDDVITWNRSIGRAGVTSTVKYDLSVPVDALPGNFHGTVNDQDILNVKTFDLSTINPGIQTPVETNLKYKYLLYLPPSYGQESQSFPLMLYLHGGGQRGSDLNRIKFDGPPKIVEDPRAIQDLFGSNEFPFVLVSPQTPSGLFWENPPLFDVITEVSSNYNIDDTRIYVTGFSMGGFGTWSFASDHAGITAAIVPIAGGRDPRELFRNYVNVGLDLRETIPEKLIDIPVWAFHGDRDSVVPIRMDNDIVEPLQALGGNIKFTVYPGVGHDSWTRTYNNPDVYQWFLSQQKDQTVTTVSQWEIY